MNFPLAQSLSALQQLSARGLRALNFFWRAPRVNKIHLQLRQRGKQHHVAMLARDAKTRGTSGHRLLPPPLFFSSGWSITLRSLAAWFCKCS